MTTSPNIIPVDIESEIEQAYLDYAMSVIIGRALPDVRDGLKPVHRRILYAQHELGNRYNSSYKKSARIVGDVIGKYHPHGDSAVYDALVRMAQDFNMRVPLVDGQGNFGSVDGDPAAAMRYTEVRMSRVTQELLGDLDKDTVDWGPNYDGTLNEPIVLPATVPNLLVNGSSGIAVGMSTNIPPHNLTEVIDATIGLIENPEMEFEELMGYIPGPDFPTGGEIYGAAGIREAYETGRGIIRIRARADIEVDDRTGKPRIIVYELPFQVNKARLIEKIADLVRDKKIDGITDLRDESDRKGMRIVIELRRDVVPEVILNNLFKMTSMQSSFGIIMLAIVHGQPKIMALKEVLNHFIDFRRDVTTRRTIYELDQAEARAHILEGLKIALDHIDEVIDLIRSSADGQAAREGLMATFGLSERQTQAILDMRLQKLTGLERDKILEELEVVRAEIDRLREILSDEGKLLEVIRGELENVRDTYGDERRTTINYSTSNLSIEDLIAEEQMVVTITHAGYIKRTPLTEYQAQRRGGRGKRGMATKDEDFVEDMFVASTHSHVLFFTSIGKVYKLKVHELPLGSRTTKGKAIINILPIEDGETVKAILPIDEFEEGRYILTATRKGVVKKTDLMAYSRVLSVGIIALSLKEDDELVAVRTTSGDDSVFLTSFNGQGILFSEEDVRPMGRTAAGVFGMRFRDDDELVSMTVIPKELMDRVQNGEEVSDRLVAVTEHGYGKRTEIGEFSVQGRGGLGVITIKTSDRNGKVVGARLVHDDDELMLITNLGQIIRMRVDGISIIGRNTQGVRLMTMDEEELVVSLARLIPEDEEEELEGEEGLEGASDSEDAEVGAEGEEE
ncbi:MAG: DNA gyrase subunit A [Myxococcota bacterium]|nr:DNA gyrase subunit A [Myxococcota bacterium]